MSLSLFLCSGEAAQGTQRQHNSEELGGPGTPHRWCPAHYKLVSRYPPHRKAPLQALGRTRKILGSARAQCQDSSLCCAQERTKYSPKQSFLSPRSTNPSLPPSPPSIPVAAPVLLLHISDRETVWGQVGSGHAAPEKQSRPGGASHSQQPRNQSLRNCAFKALGEPFFHGLTHHI